MRCILEELAWTAQLPDLAHLIRREDIPRAPQRLPRALTEQQDQLIQQELRRGNDLPANVFLLLRHTGMRIGECADLSYDCLHNVGQDRWAIHVPLGMQLTKHPGKGLGIAMNDYDRDGLPDIFIANDSVPEQLFRNRGDGTFEDVALAVGVAYDSEGRTFAALGTDFADYDNDGWPDLFVNALTRQRCALFHNHEGLFDYVSDATGIGAASIRHSGVGYRFH
jgi:integrase